MYHFISGYTAKLAGTEVGVKEPTATFSTCFGAPFMPRHPCVYAEMLGERMDRHDVPVWLINTGWTRRPVRHRRAHEHHLHTRQMVRAALNGALDEVETRTDPIFGFEVPDGLPGRSRSRCSGHATRGPTRTPTTRGHASWRRCSSTTSSQFEDRRQQGDPRGGTAPGLIRTRFDSQGALRI